MGMASSRAAMASVGVAFRPQGLCHLGRREEQAEAVWWHWAMGMLADAGEPGNMKGVRRPIGEQGGRESDPGKDESPLY